MATQVRALDNVLDVTFWPLPQQRAEAAAKRRIGVGFTGMGNALAMLCLRYDAPEGRAMAARIAELHARCGLRRVGGTGPGKRRFPKFEADGYLAKGTFASRLPEALKKAIRTHGIRNSHLLSIAPTGTVSLAFADNASNGIEPPFSWMYRRKKREADGSTSEYAVEDHAWRLYRELGGDIDQLPDYFVSALEMTAAEPHCHDGSGAALGGHRHFQDRERAGGLPVRRLQEPVPAGLARPAQGPGHLPAQRHPGLGAGHRHAQGGGAPDLIADRADPMRAVIENRPKGALPAVAEKIEYWTQEGHKTLYLVVSFLPLANPNGEGTVQRAIEFFMPVGQSGESQQWITSSMRLLSLAARGGFLERALRDMRKVAWDRGPVRLGTYQKADGTHVPLWHDSEVAAIAYAMQNIIDQRNTSRCPAWRGDCPTKKPTGGHAAGHGGQEMPRVRRARHDPQGRLRLLHPVRAHG